MKRRDFLKMTTTASGMLMCGGVKMAMAQGAPGPYWLMIEANGGWDPTSFCDPKGSGLGPNGDINNYDVSDIGMAGNIPYAPPPDSFASDTTLYRNSDFFGSHFGRLVVINGINHQTNSHASGQRASWTGTLTKNYPSIGPLVTSMRAPEIALPFIAHSNAAVSQTAGLVPRSIVSRTNLNTIRELVNPNLTSVTQTNQYHSNSVMSLIETADSARRQRKLADQRLLRLKNALSMHNAARNRDVSSLNNFVTRLDATSAANSYVRSRGQAHVLFNQAQTAFAGFESGSTHSAQIRIGGFDTHDDHDERHYPRLMDLLAGVDNIITDATSRGIADNLIIVVGSDFGRTNKYNDDNGKDHWPHTSMMVWAAPQFINGNRVVGSTDNNQVSQLVNPTTFAPSNSGIELTPEHVHQAFRNVAGIDQESAVTNAFPINQPVLPIFS